MFTAENWRNFPRLRLVLTICSMTSFFTNFYFSKRPILHYIWEVPLVPFIIVRFFCPAGHLSTSRIYWWIVRNYSYVFRVDRS